MFSLPFISETCRDVLCPGSSTCVVDQNNNANCVTCNRICPEPTLPEQYLCGNDGITYASACHLRKATCLLGRSIGLAYEGKCVSKYHGTRDYRSIFKMRGNTQRGKLFQTDPESLFHSTNLVQFFSWRLFSMVIVFRFHLSRNSRILDLAQRLESLRHMMWHG